MSDQVRLPDELAACEARLAAFSLPAVGIDRDQLLYQAGWAAAVESLRANETGAATPSTGLSGVNYPLRPSGCGEPINTERRRRLVLATSSLASAAIAASIAVIATLELRPPRIVELAAHAEPPVEAASTPVIAAAAASDPTPPVRSTAPRAEFGAGLIGLRQRALANALPEPPRTAANGDAGLSNSKSARQLLEEMLPSARPRHSLVWPWRSTAAGEST